MNLKIKIKISPGNERLHDKFRAYDDIIITYSESAVYRIRQEAKILFCKFNKSNTRKIPIISPGLIFVQKAFLLGLFSGELIFGGAYYWKEFCVSKLVGLDNRNSLNTTKTA